jgi:hypothetical protein
MISKAAESEILRLAQVHGPRSAELEGVPCLRCVGSWRYGLPAAVGAPAFRRFSEP